jgi:DNA-binding MarR family transcriptional regulator
VVEIREYSEVLATWRATRHAVPCPTSAPLMPEDHLVNRDQAEDIRYDTGMEGSEHPLYGDVNWLLNRTWLGFGQRKDAALEAIGVTLKEHFVMVALMSAPMTQLELSALVKIDKSVISATLDSLEDKGLVVRAPDPRDRRARRPTLTARGRKICQRATVATEKAEQDLLDQLDPTQRRAFLDVLRHYTFSEFVDVPKFTRDLRR